MIRWQNVIPPVVLLISSAYGQPTPAPAPASPPRPGPGVEYIKAHYTKYEHSIPMRDGKHLFTAFYVPKETKEAYPILLVRTPYSISPYGEDKYPAVLGPSEKLARDGFIFAYQDVRGRYLSEGEFLEMTPHKDAKTGPQDVDESTDTYDTIDWLVKNAPNNNGKVGMWGVSYSGFYVAAGLIDSHPALKAATPGAPMTDLFLGDDAYHNGAFMLAQNFGFYTGFNKRLEIAPPQPRLPFDYKTPDVYEFFLTAGPVGNLAETYLKNANPYWTDQVVHSTYDEYWKAHSLVSHMRNIKAAVMTVGGWFDAEDLQGPFNVYSAVKTNNPGTVNILVEGPWSHGGWMRPDFHKLGNVEFNANTAEYFHENIEFPYFSFYLKGKGDGKFPGAFVFETGANVWRKFDAWPPVQAHRRSLYLRAGGALLFEPPTEGTAFDEYISDPSKPVPTSGAVTSRITAEYMVDDQRFAATRPDVLVYQTEPLKQDLVIAGPIGCELHVSTTGTDSDFIVKLIDVYPNDYSDPEPNPTGVRMGGYQQLVRGEPFRGKFRNSFEKPEPFASGKMTDIKFSMPDLFHNFRRGHRIMVQIQSSWFPLVDRNPQVFTDIPAAKRSQFVKATQRLYRSSGAASAIVLNVLE